MLPDKNTKKRLFLVKLIALFEFSRDGDVEIRRKCNVFQRGLSKEKFRQTEAFYSHLQFSQITYCNEIHPETLPVLCCFLSMFLKYDKQSGRA